MENYRPRGIGQNWLPCYVCGTGGGSLQEDMAAFVEDKDAGERVVAMYSQLELKAKLDYRDFEPDWVQVKVGACKTHLPNLKKLEKLVWDAKGKISPKIIEASLK